jgi:Rieske 2Fe-2S family protein
MDFVQWYSEQMLTKLGYGQDHLRIVAR